MRLNWSWLLALGCALNAHAAGRLVVENAWIPVPPPGVMMLAGYAILRNAGDAPLVINGAQSESFADVSLHYSFERDGLSRMRPVDELDVQSGSYRVLEPGGYHLMLMRPKRELKAGDTVKIHISTNSGDGADAEFVVREPAP